MSNDKSAEEIVRGLEEKLNRLIELVNNPYCMGPLALLEGVREVIPATIALIESQAAEIKRLNQCLGRHGWDDVSERKLKNLKHQLDCKTKECGKFHAKLTASQQRERAARNELCLKCERYHEAHKGACDGCRWKEI